MARMTMRAIPPPQHLAAHTWTVTQAHIDAYAVASGANDFIHVDPQRAAAESPFGGTIAQGMLILAVMAEYLECRVENGALWRARGAFDVRFRRPCRPGDRLTVRATRIDSAGQTAGVVAYDMWCENQESERIIVGTATIPVDAFRAPGTGP